MGLSDIIDTFVSTIWPDRGIKRYYEREVLAKINRSSGRKGKRSATYAAAKTNRLTGSWSPADINVNDLIRGSGAKVRARVRQLVRDFPIFKRAVQVTLDHTIGTGLKFQSKAIRPNGEEDPKVIAKIEYAYNKWADEADISGKQSIYEMMRTAKQQELEGGEFLLIEKMVSDKGRYLPYALQLIETDWLTDNPSLPVPNNHGIEQGIEYDKLTGKNIYYHFTDPDSWGKSIRVPAENVIHGFETLRPGQYHGISPFVSGVLMAKDLLDYLDANIDTAKSASKYLAFVRKDPATRAGLLEDGEDDDEGKKIDEMENALIEYLNPGEDITIASNPNPGLNFPPTVKLILCLFCAATGVPYELLSFDYSGINYSSTRVIRNDLIHQLKPVIGRHIRQFCNPIAKNFLDSAVMFGGLDLPRYGQGAERFQRFSWQPPGAEMIDWLKESKARISEMGVSLRSPQEIILSRGRDFDEVLAETKAAYEKIKNAGLEFLIPIIWKSNSLSVANNPAAVEGQDNGNGNRKSAEYGHIISAIDELSDGIDALTGEN